MMSSVSHHEATKGYMQPLCEEIALDAPRVLGDSNTTFGDTIIEDSPEGWDN